VPNVVALAIPFFFVAIALELAVARGRRRTVYRLGDAMADLGCGVAQQVVSLGAGGLVLGLYGALYQHRLWTLPGEALPWVAAFFGVELTYYWWHRLSHRVNLLWAAHVVHHQSEDYNLAVALRQSVTTWATGLPFFLPLALVGVPTLHYAVMAALSLLYQFWIHTELVPRLGFLERWFNTPALHRVHHAINEGYLDKNHSATLIIWDRLFGTYAPETEACVYGTTRPLRSYNPLWAQLDGYLELWRLARRAPNPVEAVKVLFKSPAWRPAWMGEPEKRDPAVKYDPTPGPDVMFYALAQWLVLMAFVFAFIMWGAALSAPSTAVCVLLIAASLLSLPGLVEGRPWARDLEAGRVVAAIPGLLVVFLVG